jgi:hypothetical protein
MLWIPACAGMTLALLAKRFGGAGALGRCHFLAGMEVSPNEHYNTA